MEKVTTEDLLMILNDARDALNDVERLGYVHEFPVFVTETEDLIKVVRAELTNRGELQESIADCSPGFEPLVDGWPQG